MEIEFSEEGTETEQGLKTCPRCGVKFKCQPENISKCQCSGIELNHEARQKIAADFDDCLCRDCLEAFARQAGN